MERNLTLIWQRLTADRKRFGILCSLLLVGLLLWARIIVIERPPRTAIASPESVVVEELETASDKVLIIIDLDPEVTKNPFAVSSAMFPLQLDRTDNTSENRTTEDTISEQELIDNLTLGAVMGEIVMINGRVFNVGDIIAREDHRDPLRLVEVVGRSVIISAGDRRYELTIASRQP